MSLPRWMEPLLEAGEMREVDRWAISERKVAVTELMERAGEGLAAVVARRAGAGGGRGFGGGGAGARGANRVRVRQGQQRRRRDRRRAAAAPGRARRRGARGL